MEMSKGKLLILEAGDGCGKARYPGAQALQVHGFSSWLRFRLYRAVCAALHADRTNFDTGTNIPCQSSRRALPAASGRNAGHASRAVRTECACYDAIIILGACPSTPAQKSAAAAPAGHGQARSFGAS